jgi:hypothetical protein
VSERDLELRVARLERALVRVCEAVGHDPRIPIVSVSERPEPIKKPPTDHLVCGRCGEELPLMVDLERFSR